MKRSRTRLWSLIVGIVALAAGVAVFQHNRVDPAAPTPATELFFAQTLADASGVPRPLSSQRGKPLIINFWATWCVPCVQEIPAFSEASRQAGDRVSFIGLGIDSPENIRAFDARFRPSYPLLAAGAGGTELARAFGNTTGALPFTVVVGADGRVIDSHLGRVDDAKLRSWLAPFVK